MLCLRFLFVREKIRLVDPPVDRLDQERFPICGKSLTLGDHQIQHLLTHPIPVFQPHLLQFRIFEESLLCCFEDVEIAVQITFPVKSEILEQDRQVCLIAQETPQIFIIQIVIFL